MGTPEQKAPAGETEPSKMELVSGTVHKGIEVLFEHVGALITRFPVLVLISTIVLTIVLAQGAWFYTEERAADKQFTPRDSRAVQEQGYVESVFGKDNRRVEIFFVAEEGKNILDRDALEFMRSYYEWMTTEVTVPYEGEVLDFSRICGRVGGGSEACLIPRGVTSLWNHSKAQLANDPNVLDTVNSEAAWRRYVPSGSGVAYYLSREESVGQYPIGRARAAKMVVELQNKEETISGESPKDPRSAAWELALVDGTLSDRWARNPLGMVVDLSSEEEESEQQSDALRGDVTSLVVGYILLIVYTQLVLGKWRTKYSHAMLGLASVISVGMATISAYGLCWYIGIKFNNVTQVLILVLLGIGVDDTFVIMDQWLANVAELDMKQRLRKALSRAGPAITITSISDLVAFLAGSSTVLPALRDFCYYAAIGIFFDFLYQCTFFISLLYFDSVRQERNRAECLCCIKVEDDTGCCGMKQCPLECGKRKGREWKESDRGLVSKLIGTWHPRVIVGSTVARWVVLGITALFFALAVWGTTEVRMNFDIEWFTPEDARVRDMYKIRDTYFAGRNLPVAVYSKDVDYPALQDTMDLLKAEYLKNEWVVEGSWRSWFDGYRDWLVSTNRTYNGRPAVEGGKVVREGFYSLLREYVNPFVGPASANTFIKDLVWKDDGTLKASRVWFLTVEGPGSDGEKAVDCMNSLRASADTSSGELKAFPYSFPFIFWESYAVIVREALQNVGIAGACVFVIVTLMLASIVTGLMIVVVIACIDVCLIGFMYHIEVYINSVSVICIVLAIGLSVDYSVHIAHAYLTVRAEPRNGYTANQQRAAHALWSMGAAVANGGFSTFLAILPLAMAKSYVFEVFFRMFVLIICFGLWFGLFFLPVVLSFVGPPPYHNARDLDEMPKQNPLDERYEEEESEQPAQVPYDTEMPQKVDPAAPPVPIQSS